MTIDEARLQLEAKRSAINDALNDLNLLTRVGAELRSAEKARRVAVLKARALAGGVDMADLVL